MKEILESIILNIVDNRESVSINEKIDGMWYRNHLSRTKRR